MAQAVALQTDNMAGPAAPGTACMPLCFAQPGEEVKVQTLRAAGEQKNYLESLGFVEGTRVSVVSELAGSPIVEVKGARVALSRQLAQKIMVSR